MPGKAGTLRILAAALGLLLHLLYLIRYPPALVSLVVSPDETRSVLNGIAGF